MEETIQKHCPVIHNLFFSKKTEHKLLKRCVGFMYGLLLGLGFYELILVDLNFTEYAGLAVGSIICLMLALGIAFSSQIRCISMLAIPSFGGKAGRGVLKAVVLAYIISGPIQNLTSNGKEVARVFACTTSLTFNLTKARFELMFKPFTNALLGMRADVNEVKDTIRSVRDVAAPIVGEIQGEAEMRKMKEENDYLDASVGDTKRSKEIEEKYKTKGDNKYKTKGEMIEAERYEKNYIKKVEMRCQDQFSKASMKCREMFEKAYDRCYEAVTWAAAWLICWPMKLDFVCNIAEALGGASRCDPSKYIDPGLGEGYMYLKNSRSTLTENFKDVKLQYKIPKLVPLPNIRGAADTAKAVLHDVESKKTILDDMLVILKRVLAFVFLKIVIDAQKYHDTYLRDIEFDNFYITKYFRKIDARRKASDKHTLLPLKKIERQKLADVRAWKPLKKEKEQLIAQSFKLILEMLTATTFVLLDRLFYEALDLVRRHAKIDYVQSGHHDMLLQIKGTGMIASILRSLVKGFNIKKRILVKRSNAHCLPQPTLLPHYYLFKIYGTYIGIWCLIVIQAYILRGRRVICSYFYRKREKKRVLYLYNETLKRRIGFFRYMKKRVKKLAREHKLEEELNILAVLRVRYPKYFDKLKIFKMARRKCIICGEPEPYHPSGIPGDFEKCKTPTCYFVHCVECWNDMGRVCFACAQDDDTDDDQQSEDSGVID